MIPLGVELETKVEFVETEKGTVVAGGWGWGWGMRRCLSKDTELQFRRLSEFWESDVQRAIVKNTALYTWNLPKESLLSVLTTRPKKVACKVMDMLIDLIVVIITQCIRTLNHHPGCTLNICNFQ